MANNSLNGDGLDEQKNYGALFLIVIPALTIFGNGLVIASVVRNRSLRTPTNFLICSLAVADFLVALCVMPFAVYVEVENSMWKLPKFVCNVYIAIDVCASTSSILNLVAISWDRYVAIHHPMTYARRTKQRGQRMFAVISCVWLVSGCIAAPLLFGLNQLDQTDYCEFTNAAYIVASSVGSFYVPCLAILLLYGVVLRTLYRRQRLRRARKPKNNGATSGLHRQTTRDADFISNGAQLVDIDAIGMTSVSTPSDEDDMSTTANAASGYKGALEQRRLRREAVRSKNLPTLVDGVEDDDANAEPGRSIDIATDVASGNIFSAPPNAPPDEPSPQLCNTFSANTKSTLLLREGDDEEDSVPFMDEVSSPCKVPKLATQQSCDSITLSSLPSPAASRFDFQSPPPQQRSTCRLHFSLSELGMCHANHSPTLAPPSDIRLASSLKIYHSRSSENFSDTSSNRRKIATAADGLKPVATPLAESLQRRKASEIVVQKISTIKTPLSQMMSKLRSRRPHRTKESRYFRKERRATQMLAVVLGVFLLCWVPFFTCHLTNSICMLSFRNGCVPFLAFFYTTWLGYMNSFMNPLIYTVFNVEFRKAFHNLLRPNRAILRQRPTSFL